MSMEAALQTLQFALSPRQEIVEHTGALSVVATKVSNLMSQNLLRRIGVETVLELVPC
jgi:hypothetical protein